VRRLLPPGRLRIGLIVADQSLVSLGSFALTSLVARALSPSLFGYFTLLYSAYLLVLGVSRALASEPLLVRYPGADRETLRDGSRWSAGVALGAGAVSGLIGLALLPLLHGQLRLAELALALLLPGLLLKDAWRYCFFALARPVQALLNDALWTAAQIAAIVWVSHHGPREPVAMVGAWGVTGCLCALLGAAQARMWPHPRRAVAYLRRHRDLAPRFALEYLVAGGPLQVTIWLSGVIDTVVTAGALRAGETLLGPARILIQAAQPAIVPEGSRMLREDHRHVLPTSLIVSAVLTLATLAWAVLLLLFIPRFGADLFGATWPYARPVVLPLAAASVTNAIWTGPTVGLRILAAAAQSLRVRLVTAPLTLALATAGVVWGGAPAAAWGIAAGGAIGIAAWWYALLMELRRRSGRPAGEPA
jgi:O-antigen/teichoic acid export membrane protein